MRELHKSKPMDTFLVRLWLALVDYDEFPDNRGRIAAALIGASTGVDVTDTVRSLLPIRQANTGPRNETDTVQTGRLNAGSPSLVQGVVDGRMAGAENMAPVRSRQPCASRGILGRL